MSNRQPHLPGAKRWYDAWSRYLSLLAFLVTALTTVIVFFTTGEELGGLGALITACIGLLGLAISLQLETLFRVAERAQTRERYGRMLELIEDYPDLLPLTRSALEASVRTLRQSRLEEFKEEVFNVLAHADAGLQELAQGRLRTVDGDNTLVLERFGLTREVLRGTTDDGDTDWWERDSGAQFFELNKGLIAKGIRVERVWILAKKPSTKLQALIKSHYAAGVHVYLLRADRKNLDRRLLVNLTMMDESFMQEDLPNKMGQAVEYLYSENSADLERARSRFAQLKSVALEYQGEDSMELMFKASNSGSN